MDAFVSFKISSVIIYIIFKAAGIVPCGGRKKSPEYFIVQVIYILMAKMGMVGMWAVLHHNQLQHMSSL